MEEKKKKWTIDKPGRTTQVGYLLQHHHEMEMYAQSVGVVVADLYLKTKRSSI